jgi:hypothetical protein
MNPVPFPNLSVAGTLRRNDRCRSKCARPARPLCFPRSTSGRRAYAARTRRMQPLRHNPGPDRVHGCSRLGSARPDGLWRPAAFDCGPRRRTRTVPRRAVLAHGLRVHVDPIHEIFIVQMRSRGKPGHAHVADALSLIHMRAEMQAFRKPRSFGMSYPHGGFAFREPCAIWPEQRDFWRFSRHSSAVRRRAPWGRSRVDFGERR